MTELVCINPGVGESIYVILRRDADESAANIISGEAEAFTLANWTDYVIELTETPANSNYYTGDQPAWTKGTVWNALYYKQAGASPAATDPFLGTEKIVTDTVAEDIPEAGALISKDYYKSVVSTDATDAKLDALIAEASRWIENVCHCQFTASARTEIHSGDGSPWLRPNALPASIQKITFNPHGNAPTDYAGSEFVFTTTGWIYFKPSSDKQRSFPSGFENIEISYTSGGTVPDGVRAACWKKVYLLEMSASPDLLVTEKSVGDEKVKYADAGIYQSLEQQILTDLAPYLRPVIV